MERVCAAAAAGEETLASLFAAAATKQILEIDTLDDILESEFQECETGRPPGCAQTILRIGGLDVMGLLDGGATCSAAPEEVVLAIIGHALKQVEQKKYTFEDPACPVVSLQRLVQKPRIDGVAAGAPKEITYAVVLRTEFVPVGETVLGEEECLPWMRATTREEKSWSVMRCSLRWSSC